MPPRSEKDGLNYIFLYIICLKTICTFEMNNGFKRKHWPLTKKTGLAGDVKQENCLA